MKKLFYPIMVLLLLNLVSCGQNIYQTEVNSTPPRLTTEAQEKRLTADEVTDLLKDKFDITKENCQYEVY